MKGVAVYTRFQANGDPSNLAVHIELQLFSYLSTIAIAKICYNRSMPHEMQVCLPWRAKCVHFCFEKRNNVARGSTQQNNSLSYP